MAKAFVLIEARDGGVGEAATALRDSALQLTVKSVDTVTGPYDIIVTLETDDVRNIGRIVLNEMHSIEAIKRTVTCLVL